MSWLKKDPIGVEIQGTVLKCLICGHDAFWKKEAQLNTQTTSIFNMEWLATSGTCYVCSKCGYIHWFLPQ